MKTSDFAYDLPEELIAREPPPRREDSRLMRVPRNGSAFSHHRFADLPELLRPGDLLVLNDTRVFPARLLGRRYPGGGHVEALLVRAVGPDLWLAMVRPGKRIHAGDRLIFWPGRLEAHVETYGAAGSGERLLRFQWSGDWWQTLEEVGHTPLPPYILKARASEARRHGRAALPERPEDRQRYQTVYAGAERASVAAPTAGLHFTGDVLEALERRGVGHVFLRLHVGPGTFRPIKTNAIEDHDVEEEYFHIGAECLARIEMTRRQGGRVVAVGTTVVRALETAALARAGLAGDLFRSDAPSQSAGQPTGDHPPLSPSGAVAGWTHLFVRPGFDFRLTQALITNFHLPCSSLLVLVCALAGRETALAAYREAVRERYRFYSYGDCMLIE